MTRRTGRNILFITADQWHNRWEDPGCRAVRDDVVEDLYASLPSEVRRLDVAAPA